MSRIEEHKTDVYPHSYVIIESIPSTFYVEPKIKNGRSNAEGVFCFLEQELLKGMDKRSAVNPIPISPYLNHKLVVALNKL